MVTLIVGCTAAIVVLALILAILSVPVMIILSLAPWALAVAGVVLLVKALTEKPMRWENFMPAVVAFLLSGLIRWIF
ncbi:MAG: phage-shock protein [Pseudoflavonifractor capillosus]|mgnify:CR=1 FL=1|uniref:phage-shock protein n=1 Tax=Pseudoflavonifractor capillosus TaxID=106588 RepID=UPI0023FA38BC|nr:phage-shock protein [Pseudoflavonifractor capillosus]MCI5927242.1 phage-shock protein [Pseudoflavonifractor capillosus]MDY4661674.1 phage-shock protein [Pseudoflavonifractor capillosus]